MGGLQIRAKGRFESMENLIHTLKEFQCHNHQADIDLAVVALSSD